MKNDLNTSIMNVKVSLRLMLYCQLCNPCLTIEHGYNGYDDVLYTAGYITGGMYEHNYVVERCRSDKRNTDFDVFMS